MVFHKAADVSLNNVCWHGLQNRAIVCDDDLLYPSHRVRAVAGDLNSNN